MPRQLLMVHLTPAAVPAPQPPEDVVLTTYRPGDEADWVKLVLTGQLGDQWTAELARRDLTGRDVFQPEGFFIARHRATGRPLATACAFAQRAFDRDWPGLHMVAVDPADRGRGLGKVVCQAVLHYWGQRVPAPIILTTDDWRLPATATYGKLGWQAIRFREDGEDHLSRWTAVWDLLNAPPPWRLFAPPIV